MQFTGLILKKKVTADMGRQSHMRKTCDYGSATSFSHSVTMFFSV